MSQTIPLHTGAWYGDHEIAVELPDSWQVAMSAPGTGRPLTDDEIRQRLRTPVGQPPIREAFRGCSRPLIILDDLNRPTPASLVVPTLLEELEEAGVSAGQVRILMGPGTHGAPAADALPKKVGQAAASACRLIVHDSRTDGVRIGRTSFGTPVLVNREVLESDAVIGVGGLYPNHTAGFGGGAKLAIGVLGFRSIANLHFRHKSAGWGSFDVGNAFRRDLDEIARMIGLETTISLLVDSQRRVVDCICADTHTYYADALESWKETFRTPGPGSSDVVIANAYPNDLSLTFVRMKGTAPFAHARAGASRVVIAACPEGLGFHGLFPFMNVPRGHRARILAMRLPIILQRPGETSVKMGRRLLRQVRRRPPRSAPLPVTSPSIWLYRTAADRSDPLPEWVPDMRISSSWEEIVEGVMREQGGRASLKASLYACAPLQWIG